MDDVIFAVFGYIGILNGPGGVTAAVFEEHRALARLRFDFRDKMQPYSFTQSVAHCMHTYDAR